MSPITDDPNDPRLGVGVGGDGMNAAYLVLSEEERSKGYVRPFRDSYLHEKCGTVTTMNEAIAATYAARPSFYGATYCSHCQTHLPVGADGEFVWVENGQPTDLKVGV